MRIAKSRPRPPKAPPRSDAERISAIANRFPPALPRREQEKLRSRGRRTPVAVIELMASLAEEHGTIAGMRFDAKAIRAALAHVKSAQATAKSALRLARRAQSDAVRTFTLAADTTMAATVALSRLVRAPKAALFREANARVRAMMRAKRTGREQ